jgi:hypothetical protein
MGFLKILKFLVRIWTEWGRPKDRCVDCEHGGLMFAGHGGGIECRVGARREARCASWLPKL